MAFPVPDHLPRAGATPQNKASQILSKFSDATSKTLTVELTSSWRVDLDTTIRETKGRIHDRINADLPSFNRQLASAKSVQRRLHDISENTDRLSNCLSNPETGLLPTLLKSLSEHSALTQQALDARVLHAALRCLSKCKDGFQELARFIGEGRLPEAVTSCKALQLLLDSAPDPLPNTSAMADLKRRFLALQNSVEEQLSDAYSRSIRISSSELVICSSVQVRQSPSVISLSDILSSLTPASLSTLLSSLRRDMVAYFIEYPLQQPMSASIQSLKDEHGSPSLRLSLFPNPSPDQGTSPLACLSILIGFLYHHLFPCLPQSERASFPDSLCKPITSSIMKNLLVLRLPSSLNGLPPFLSLVLEAAQFERETVVPMMRDTRRDMEVKSWADNVGKHYGRKRRINLLQEARQIVSLASEEGTFEVDVEDPTKPTLKALATNILPDVIAVQEREDTDGWGFNDEGEEEDKLDDPSHHDSDGQDAACNLYDKPSGAPIPSASSIDVESPEVEDVDAEDAWGLGDDDNEITQASEDMDNQDVETNETAWDNVWDEPPPPKVTPPLVAPPLNKQPKIATRLEKFAMKDKSPSVTNGNTHASPAMPSPSLSSYSMPSVMSMKSPLSVQSPLSLKSPQFPSHSNDVHAPVLKPVNIPVQLKPKDKYVVSVRTKKVLGLVEDVIMEGRELTLSHIFDEFHAESSNSSTNSSPSSPSSLILQSAPLILDLFRALYPVAFTTQIAQEPSRTMRFSNDCLYLGDEIKKVLSRIKKAPLPGDGSGHIVEQLRESGDRLGQSGEWLFEDAVDKQSQRIISLLDCAEGFVETSDQERFDVCEATVGDVLRETLSLGYQWKTTLTRGKYHSAIGRVVESALTRLLSDIVGLPDITEVESHKLSELCRILNSLERLFIDDVDSPSMVVAYVPSWLKFSYLSELLEASIADISYLFEEGALIDFSVDELVGLMRALFADTPLRANTIAKLMNGHPPPR